MKTMFAAIMMGAAALVPAPVQAGAVLQASSARPEADRLVAVMLADAAMMDVAGRAFTYGMEQQLANDPATQKLYAANPGMKEHVAGQVRTEFLKVMKAELPALRGDVSQLIQADMTAPEITDARTFLESATGRKMAAQMYRSIGDKPDQSQEQMQQAAMASLMRSLTPEDYPALLAFGGSPAAQKLQALNPKITAASQVWSSRLIAANEARMKTLAAQSAAEFLKGKK
ncbi:DUF2059 domain-containing protein [Sphingomonas sp. S2-65]|uniref:DUF2059 domain-containing protein n=1 Tax=Sphingomonas sp. S2-65 TaxID=2903960 RepID=UPI001F2669DE|nr:hypothetical protein [Sphingomonas sp. S2-65]UYY56995.1 hypothetical protein LZ586_09865 [Sphingomonas sp. S2-65]